MSGWAKKQAEVRLFVPGFVGTGEMWLRWTRGWQRPGRMGCVGIGLCEITKQDRSLRALPGEYYYILKLYLEPDVQNFRSNPLQVTLSNV